MSTVISILTAVAVIKYSTKSNLTEKELILALPGYSLPWWRETRCDDLYILAQEVSLLGGVALLE